VRTAAVLAAGLPGLPGQAGLPAAGGEPAQVGFVLAG
jgi:hypothetical protein